MSKATIALSVKADTSSARKSLQELDKEVNKMQQKAQSRNKKQSKEGDSLFGFDFSNLKTKGLEAITASLKQIPIAGDLAAKSFSKLSGAFSGLSGLLVGGVTLVYKLATGLMDWVNFGSKASEEFRKINTSLSTLAKNLGSTVSTKGLTQDIQWLAAEGVGNIDQLTQAAKTLMVAFDGNQAAVRRYLPMIDDLAQGANMSAEQFAALMARVDDAGKVESRVFNTLKSQGLPVYDALAEVLGTTGTAAQEAAAKGEISMQQWYATIEKLHEAYKGLSAELSSNTLEGARATYEAAKSLAYKGAADAADAVEIARLNTKAAQFKIDAFDQELQIELAAAGTIVGKVRAGLNSLGEDLTDFWGLATKAVSKVTSWLGNAGDIVATNLIRAASPFEYIPNFAGSSAKDIGEYLAEATDYYKQMEGLVSAGTAMEEDTAAQLRDSMRRIKANIEIAEKASKEAMEAEQRAKDAEIQANKEAADAAAAKAKADKEAADKARQEAAERKRSEEAIKQERIARLKNVQDYAKHLNMEEARVEADTAADAGDLTKLEEAADKMAQAAGMLSMTDLETTLAALTEKIKNNPEGVTQEELDKHKELLALMQEVTRLQQEAEKTRQDAENRAQEEQQQRQQAQDEYDQRCRDNEQEAQEEAQENARRKASDDPAAASDLAEAAAQYKQELLDAGFALEEARELFDQWVNQQMDKAQDNLTADTHYKDKDGKRILADPDMKNSLKELASQAHSGDLESRREAAAQLKEVQEANRLAKEQLSILSKLKFEAKAQ